MNAITTNTLVDLMIILCIILALASIILIITNYRLKKESNKIARYSININAKVNEEIPMILENMTEECFDEYMVLNLAFKEKEYIDSDTETKIMKEVGTMVAQRLSQAALDKLSTYYNINTISEIISNKVYILVMQYAANNNQIPSDSNS